MQPIHGLIAAAHTPFYADGSLRLEVIDRLAERFAGDGLAGVFPCGTTGEFASLTVEERMQVAERWCAVAGRDLKVIVHAGATALADAKALAAHAQSCGAAAISAVGPYYYRPQGVAELVAFSAEVAASAPTLPFLYYHIPSLSGVDVPMADFLAAAAARIPTLAGVKFSHLDLLDLGRCVKLDGGRFQVFFGADEVLLSGLALGCRAAVGTTYSFAAPLYQGILADFNAGEVEDARRKQARAMDMVAVFQRYGLHPAMKVVMRLSGIDCGPVRLPLRELSAREVEALEVGLGEIGFAEFRSRA
jgi:N-acetylneuraminate lyase